MIKLLIVPGIIFAVLWLGVGLSLFWSLVLTFVALFALGSMRKKKS